MTAAVPGTEASPLASRWAAIADQRSSIAEALDRAAAGSVGSFARHLRQLSRRVAQVDRTDWRRHDAEVLTLTAPWLAGTANLESIDEVVDHYHDHWEAISERESFFSTLAYPLITAAVCGGLFIVFCLTVVNEFRVMFEEFGLELPAPTALLFWTAALIETWWPLIIGVPLASTAAMLGLRFASQRLGTPTLGQRLRRLAQPSRVAIQDAALILATLTAGDLPRQDAVRVAAAATHRRWLRRWLNNWADRLTTATGLKPPIGAKVLDRFRRHHGGLLPVALQLPREVCVDAMRVTAAMAGDRQRTSMRVLGFLLGEGVLAMIGLLVGFAVVTLFMPLVSLISGLT